MRKILRILCIAITMAASINSKAQCSTVTLNWDYLDYFIYQNNYTSGNYYLPALSWAQTQNFAFGTQRLTVANNYAATNIGGDVSTHTGETGSYGAGDDIQFTGDGTITFTFESSVTNLKFSLYDIDRNQRAQFNAVNGVTPVNITLSKVSGGIISFTNNGTTTPRADAIGTTVANTSSDGTVNVDVAGPVTQITITVSNTGTCGSSCGTGGNESGIFFVSDITACSVGNFPNNYYNISKPFTGQASYVLHAFDNSVYAINPVTGVTRLLFSDPSGENINSMGYDPYNRVLYYVYSLTANAGINKSIYKYDFKTKTISTVLADVTTIGIPVVTATSGFSVRGTGVESGAAAFYNGCLYLGIETTNKSSATGTLATSNREAVIYRIDFDGSNVPYRASQVYALPVDNGSGALTHDWSDFVINDGVLYDFDGAGSSGETDIYQVNLMTGSTTNFNSPATYAVAADRFVPGQVAVDWTGNIYNLTATPPGGGTITPYVALYNSTTGKVGTKNNITSTPAYPAGPSVGDAAEAFRWPVDFGDAPASYDPAGPDPAVNEISSNLYLGTSEDDEIVTRGQTALANSDNYDDGLSTVTIFNPNYGNYLTSVKVYNNSGANAAVCAWLDFNGNGVFDVAEGITVTVPNSATTQSVYLYWPFISSALPMGSYTYLRIRVTSASNGMTTANSIGYFNNGETEDYRVPVNTFPLSIRLLAFDAKKTTDKKVNLLWQVAYEQSGVKYELQRSTDMQNWTSIGNIAVTSLNSNHNYTDTKPLSGNSFYRIKLQDIDGSISYSQCKKIEFESLSLAFTPNPASNTITLTVSSDKKALAHLSVSDMNGRLVHKQILSVQQGVSTINLPFVEKLNAGVYSIQLELNDKIYTSKLMKK